MVIVYALCHPDGTPFYIGLTQNMKKRFAEHLATATSRKSVKDRVIARILDSGEQPLMHFLALCETREIGLEVEAFWIGRYRRLTNKANNRGDLHYSPTPYTWSTCDKCNLYFLGGHGQRQSWTPCGGKVTVVRQGVSDASVPETYFKITSDMYWGINEERYNQMP